MSEQKLVANELLAFLQHRLDVMDEISVTQICTSNFNEGEIHSAKELLYETLGLKYRMTSRRRDEKGERSLQDIIKLLKETDPDDVPTFVAKDLSKLPPVTFDHVDVTRLLKDITSLKVSLAEVMHKFEASQNIIADLRNEVDSLRNTILVSRSAEATNNVNNRRGAYASNVPMSSSFESAKLSPTPASSPCATRAAMTDSSSAPARPADSPAMIAAPLPAAPITSPLSKRDYACAASQPSRQKQDPKPKRGQVSEPPRTSTDNKLDEDGFVKVQKKRKLINRNQCGTAPTGPNFMLRPATPTTALYLSRLHHSTKMQDVVEYIKLKAKVLVKVDPLDSRHDVHFKAFVARVPTAQLGTFMKEDFWPKGVVFRRFRGRLRDANASTAPSLVQS